MLAGLDRRHRDLEVQEVGRNDVDDVDVRISQCVAPVGGVAGIAQRLGAATCEILARVDQHREARPERRAAVDTLHIAVPHRVGLGHQTAADHGDTDLGNGGSDVVQGHRDFLVSALLSGPPGNDEV